MSVDVETKYFFIGFLYVGKDESRSGDVSVPTDIVMKLMMPLFKNGHNVTSDREQPEKQTRNCMFLQ